MKRKHHRARSARTTAIRTVVLAAGKGAAGLLSGSMALLMDGIGTLSHSLAPLARFASHKKGPVRSESSLLRTLPVPFVMAIAVYLFLGFEGVTHSLESLLSDAPASHSQTYRLIGLAAAAVCSVLHGAAWLRGDKKSSEMARVLRAGLLPSLLALLGSMGLVFSDSLGNGGAYRLDAACGLAIGMLILVNGWKLATRQTSDSILPGRGHRDVEELIKAAQEVRGIIMVDALEAREDGHYVAVVVTVSVNPHISVFEGQEIARALSSHLTHEFLHLSEVTVIVHPYDRGYPYNNGIGSEHPVFPPMVH
ncbi:cation transporter [Gorillibacterium sp. sgz500922]|uniref:cation transporter n=1 Tax=Gorillibacterium sp. sgz500922 TaxID=3446694 RepID=UPI003F67D285